MLIVLACIAGTSHVHAQQQLESRAFDLSDYRGKVVYVDFWASWCKPCRASFPFMADLAERHGDDLAIIAINVDENRAEADTFLAEFRVPFDVVFDPEGDLASEFEVPGMPTSFLYDRLGKPVGTHVGFRKKDQQAIKNWIEAQL